MNVSNSLSPEAIKRQIEKGKTQSNANESEQSDNVFDRALEIREKSATIYELSQEMHVQNQEELKGVIEILQDVRQHREKIVRYWKPAKESANRTYKEIVSKEKEMLEICDKTMQNLKKEILYYKSLQEQKTLKISDEAEKNGDKEAAQSKLKQAEMIENLENYTAKIFQNTDGIITQRRWQVRILDNKSVPAFFNETEIREINTKKLLEIRKQNPSVKIPGVEFYQIESVVIKT